MKLGVNRRYNRKIGKVPNNQQFTQLTQVKNRKSLNIVFFFFMLTCIKKRFTVFPLRASSGT